MQRPICQRCEIEFRPHINGVKIVELCHKNKEIYKIWGADLWRCPHCGNRIIFGFANKPIYHNGSQTQEQMQEYLNKIEKGGIEIFYNQEANHFNEEALKERQKKRERKTR